MNYGRNNTSMRRSALQHGAPKKKSKKTNFRFLRNFCLVLVGIALVGLVAGGFVLKKIIDDTPEITADSLKPSAYTTYAYANDGRTV